MKKLNIALSITLLASVTAFAQKPVIEFNARGIVALSDADMVASSHVDGKLMNEVGSRDLMTTIALPLNDRTQVIGTAVVSNTSVTLTKNMAISSDGRLAFVIENRTSIPDSIKRLKNLNDLPAGAKMYVVDLGNPKNPTVKFGAPIGKLPTAIDILQNQLIIVGSETDKEIQLVEVDGTGRPTRLLNTPLKMQGVTISDVAWHPEGEFISVTLEESKSLMLFKARRSPQGKIIAFDPFGKPLAVGAKPTSGKFTPDGNFFIITDLKDGSAAGEIIVVQYNLTDPNVEHKIVSQAAVGVSPEGFDISADGSMVVTANMNKSYYPWESAELTHKSSISLLNLGKDGKIAKVADYDFEGIRPESIIFDKTGDHVAVSVYEYFNYGIRHGGIEFFKVNKGATPSLTKSDVKVNVARGCHALKMIP